MSEYETQVCMYCGKKEKVHWLDACDIWECQECLEDLE